MCASSWAVGFVLPVGFVLLRPWGSPGNLAAECWEAAVGLWAAGAGLSHLSLEEASSHHALLTKSLCILNQWPPGQRLCALLGPQRIKPTVFCKPQVQLCWGLAFSGCLLLEPSKQLLSVTSLSYVGFYTRLSCFKTNKVGKRKPRTSQCSSSFILHLSELSGLDQSSTWCWIWSALHLLEPFLDIISLIVCHQPSWPPANPLDSFICQPVNLCSGEASMKTWAQQDALMGPNLCIMLFFFFFWMGGTM